MKLPHHTFSGPAEASGDNAANTICSPSAARSHVALGSMGVAFEGKQPRRPVARSTRPPKVALLVETSNSYARGLLAGVKNFVRNHRPWNVHLSEHSRGDRPPAWLANWDGDGILARIENKQVARSLAALQVPVVDISSHQHLPGVPVVTTDNAAVARLAFGHFTERGFRHFAYCGVERFAWSMARGGHFDELVRNAGLNCDHFAADRDFGPDSDAETDAIAQWLEGLPKPVAVFACYDARGQQLLEASQRAGLAVPDQVAVLGVDNDDLLCDFSPPPLSSIILDTNRIGWEAAAWLSRLIDGEPTRPQVMRFAPLGVCTRQSTDTYAVDDAQVACALRLIRENACAGLTVSELAKKCSMSRRVLERRMHESFGRSPHEEITRVQIRRVKDLLLHTKLTLEHIAERSGFRDAQYLSVVFKRQTGLPPSEFRTSQALTNGAKKAAKAKGKVANSNSAVFTLEANSTCSSTTDAGEG